MNYGTAVNRNGNYEHYYSLFQFAPIAIYSCDASGVILEYNKHAAKLWGREPKPGDTDERFCGSFKLYCPDGTFMPHEKCPMADVLDGRLPEVRSAEVHIERPDGSRIIAFVNIAPRIDSEGKITGAVNCFYDVTERKREEGVRIAELEAMQHGLHTLSSQLMRSQDDERRRIARDLHDSAGQTLVALKMNLSALTKESGNLTLEANRRLSESIKMLEEMNTELRTISHLLHPPLLDEVGLLSGIRWFVEGFAERSKVQVSLEMPSEFGRLPSETETAIFRVIQECLTNIHRHSGSSTASVHVARNSHEISMEVRDQGKGIPREPHDGTAPSPLKPGVGILGMRERVRQLGGRLEIRSGPDGTTVQAVFPMREANAQSDGFPDYSSLGSDGLPQAIRVSATVLLSQRLGS